MFLQLNIFFCPQRCRGLRELHLANEDHDGDIRMAAVRDNWVRRIGTSYEVYFGDDKTSDTHGPTRAVLEPASLTCNGRSLYVALATYVRDHRRNLVLPGADDCGCLFLTNRGVPFTDGEFSAWIQDSFEGLCGRRVSFNLLRSAFVTAMMEDEEASANPGTREGVAASMRSSVKYQQQSYDRRTASQIADVGRAFSDKLRSKHDKGATAARS